MDCKYSKLSVMVSTGICINACYNVASVTMSPWARVDENINFC